MFDLYNDNEAQLEELSAGSGTLLAPVHVLYQCQNSTKQNMSLRFSVYSSVLCSVAQHGVVRSWAYRPSLTLLAATLVHLTLPVMTGNWVLDATLKMLLYFLVQFLPFKKIFFCKILNVFEHIVCVNCSGSKLCQCYFVSFFHL